MHRLDKKGMDKGSIPGFIWSMKSCIHNHPDLDCGRLNRKLETLGWHNFQLDDATLQLIMACFPKDRLRNSSNQNRLPS